MNVLAKFDEIPSMILQDIKKTKRYGHTAGRSFGRTVGRTVGRTDGQRDDSIPSHKRSLRGYNNEDGLDGTVSIDKFSSVTLYNW